MRRFYRSVFSALYCLLFFCGYAQATGPKIDSFVLSNGLEVVVVENHRIPAVIHTLWYRVGGADDARGKSGLAHYLEHMMFQGTPAHKAGEFSALVSAAGGNHNAFTGRDFTAYYVNIAKEKLPLVMELEADRMQHLNPPPDNFAKEREVIIEERRERVENNPSALLGEQMDAALLRNHPYRIPLIGWKEEMEKLSLQDVHEFHRRFYHPSNAVLVVAGDITAAELKPLAERYYGAIPAGEPVKRAWNGEPEPIAPVAVALKHKEAREREWRRNYIAPGMVYGQTRHALPLFALAQALGGGQTSRLYQSLVVKQKLATGAGADYNGLALGPVEFAIWAVPAPGVPFAAVESAVEKELARLREGELASQELTRAKTLLKAHAVFARDGLEGIANIVGELRMLGLPAAYVHSWTEEVGAITAQDVRAAAQAVLSANNFVTGTLEPDASPRR